jgi:hypothetical protein
MQVAARYSMPRTNHIEESCLSWEFIKKVESERPVGAYPVITLKHALSATWWLQGALRALGGYMGTCKQPNGIKALKPLPELATVTGPRIRYPQELKITRFC